MKDTLIDEDFLSKNLSFTENAKRSLATSSRFDFFSGIFIEVLSVVFLGLFIFAVYKHGGFKEFFNGAENYIIIIVLLTVLASVFLLFFGFFKIRGFLTIRKILKNPSSKSLEKIFNERIASSLFLSLAIFSLSLVLIVLAYAIATDSI